MICPHCYGHSQVLSLCPSQYTHLCPTCHGFGVIHCCEGDQAGPTEVEHPTATQPGPVPPAS